MQSLVLGFDTSGPHCAACLMLGETVLGHRFQEMTRGQAEQLVPLLEDLLTEAGKTWDDLDSLGVGIGPGNFTGIRISVSAARGMALGLGIPAVGVNGFDALALDAGAVVTTIAAPRDQLYVGLPGASPVLTSLDRMPLPPARTKADVIGHSASEIAAKTGGTARDPAYPLAEAIARLAQSRMHDIDLPRPAPLYIRPADAAPARDSGPVILDDA